MPLILILTFLLTLTLISSAYSADFAQVGTIGTPAYVESPVKVLQDKPHVLCDKCPANSKFTPIVAFQASGLVMKVKPKKAPEPVIVEETKVIYFPLNKTTPIGGDDIKKTVKHISDIESVEVRGFTCDLGSKKRNDRLALKRAEVVSGMLQEVGVSKEKISMEGLGKCCYQTSPAQSRRVEITIKSKKFHGGQN